MTLVEIGLLGGFAAIGLWWTIFGVVKGAMTVFGIVRDLAATLKEAVAIAREFRSDFAIIRQAIGIQAQQPAVDAEYPEEKPRVPVEFPAPFIERFQSKPPEPEAPAEAPGAVDVTPEDSELLEEDALEELRRMGMKTEAIEEEYKAGRGVESD